MGGMVRDGDEEWDGDEEIRDGDGGGRVGMRDGDEG